MVNYLCLETTNLHVSFWEESANDKDLARLRDAVRSSASNLFASRPHALGYSRGQYAGNPRMRHPTTYTSVAMAHGQQLAFQCTEVLGQARHALRNEKGRRRRDRSGRTAVRTNSRPGWDDTGQ